ncbi:transporter substrate-binding domain-containing protein [Faecalicatena orotica]|uniref:transporter substrate-binding domain-containing protein n=2 Tax=Clostridia TaxID=186801 RepID=UPI001FAB2690|nr:transporter substrate-binding domain-containing protein [Faecalicatena orotica]
MKRKIISTMIAAAMAAVLAAGCGSSKAAGTSAGVKDSSKTTAEQSSEGASKKVLRVGMECAYAPFNWTQETDEVANDDKAVPIYGTNYYAYGYDVMMAKKIADGLGWDLEVHKVEWDSIGMGLDSKEYDCIIAGMGKTGEREQAYDFTEPYYYRDICITVKKGSGLEDIKKLSDFKGKDITVTTQLGTAWVDLLDQIPDVQLGANYATTAECFMAVSNGAADACVIDLPTSQSAALTNDDLVLLDLDESDTIEDPTGSTNVCIAVRKGDTELKDSIQGVMDQISWNDKAKMDEMMGEAIKLQPAAN